MMPIVVNIACYFFFCIISYYSYSHINSLSYIIGALLFTGIAIGGWTDMIKGWEIREYQGIGAIEFPVYPIRTVIIFSSIIIVFIYLTLIFKTFVNDKKKSLNLY